MDSWEPTTHVVQPREWNSVECMPKLLVYLLSISIYSVRERKRTTVVIRKRFPRILEAYPVTCTHTITRPTYWLSSLWRSEEMRTMPITTYANFIRSLSFPLTLCDVFRRNDERFKYDTPEVEYFFIVGLQHISELVEWFNYLNRCNVPSESVFLFISNWTGNTHILNLLFDINVKVNLIFFALFITVPPPTPGVRKYVLWCLLCGGAAGLLGIMFLGVYFLIRNYTSSVAYFETVPTFVPSTLVSFITWKDKRIWRALSQDIIKTNGKTIIMNRLWNSFCFMRKDSWRKKTMLSLGILFKIKYSFQE